MFPASWRRRDDRSGRPLEREDIVRAVADPAADLAALRDPRQALRRRLWHWHFGSRIGVLSKVAASEARVASAPELIELAAIHAEAGLLTTAADLVERALAGDPRAFDRLRFVGLTAGLHRMVGGRFEKYAAEADAAQAFRANYGTFRRLVEAHADSICVVGNAPSEVGLGRGAAIDRHDLVIRFNNYSADPRHQADYGRKTDIWVRGSHFRNVWRRQEERYTHTLVADDVYWRAPNGQNALIDSALFGERFEDAPRRVITELTVRLGAKPSSGLIVLTWLAQILGGLDRASVFGFSLSDQTEGLRHYYPETRASKAPHDWVAERTLFAALVGPR